MQRQSLIRQNLQLRAKIIHAIRKFFMDRDYLEVETPCRIPAPAPEANIDVFASEGWFLHTSPELCMKRLMAAGYSRIFQICRCFRQAERGSRHLPEFTMLEWYCEGSNYFGLMEMCEALIQYVAHDTGTGDVLMYQGQSVDLTSPWERMSVSEAFDKFAAVSMKTALLNDCFDEIMACEIEPHLGQEKPVFLYDYPGSACSLSKLKPEDRFLGERFEFYIRSMELCNGFTELTDPVEQRMRFDQERLHRYISERPIYPMPERFLDELQYMPDAAGNALGIDRLVMLFANIARIDDGVAFIPEEL